MDLSRIPLVYIRMGIVGGFCFLIFSCGFVAGCGCGSRSAAARKAKVAEQHTVAAKKDRWKEVERMIGEIEKNEQSQTAANLDRLRRLNDIRSLMNWNSFGGYSSSEPLGDGTTAGVWMAQNGFAARVVLNARDIVNDQQFRLFIDKNNPTANAKRIIDIAVDWSIQFAFFQQQLLRIGGTELSIDAYQGMNPVVAAVLERSRN